MDNSNKNDITIIVPVFNEEQCIFPFVEEIRKVQSHCRLLSDCKILFIDDGSTDETLNMIKDISNADADIFWVSFSRNFGKEAAIFAGLKESYKEIQSDYYVIMDVDLQDPPSLLPEMIEKFQQDFSLNRVATYRKTRKGEPFIRSLFAKCFYKLMNTFAQVKLKDGARDYQMMKKKYVKSIIDCGEYNRFFKGLSQWVGYKTYWIDYDNMPRQKGTTKWSFWSLLGYSLEGMIAFSTWPLRFISFLGLLVSLISLVFLIIVIVRAMLVGDPVAGWPSLTCIILLLGGLILVCLGILGLYFEKAYLETKNRPRYIVEDDNYSNR